jgi:hypothetical protein
MLGQFVPRPRIGLAVAAGIAVVASIGLAHPDAPLPCCVIAEPCSFDDLLECVADYA